MRLDDLRLTSSELSHLVNAARALAAQARDDGSRQANPAMRQIFADAEATYLALAGKCERLRRLAG
jgi:hypothetical protein